MFVCLFWEKQHWGQAVRSNKTYSLNITFSTFPICTCVSETGLHCFRQSPSASWIIHRAFSSPQELTTSSRPQWRVCRTLRLDPWVSNNSQDLPNQPSQPCYTSHPCSNPACDSAALKSYLIRHDFSATPFSVLFKMVGKYGCKNGNCKLSKASSHSETSLSSHHLFQGKQLEVHGVVFCVDVKYTTLHCQDVASSPLSCARYVAKEGRVSGCGAGEGLTNWTLWSGLIDRRIWVSYLEWFEELPDFPSLPDLVQSISQSVLYDVWMSTMIYHSE